MDSDSVTTACYERLAVAFLLAGGAAARLIWASKRLASPVMTPVLGESRNIAASLARTGNFADAFANGSGATAHIGMLTPLPSAALYRLLGVATPSAEWALVVWNIMLVSLGAWLCWRLACILGAPRLARLAAVALVSLMPLQFNLEMREGRNWEVGLATAMLLWVLLRLALADRMQTVGGRSLAVTGALSGLLFIVSPPAGLAAVVAIGLFQIMRLQLPQWWIAPAGFLLVVGVLAGFWAERNLVRFGEAIPLRDNFGLELDLSNYAGAVHPADQHAAYLARFNEIHPLGLGGGLRAMQAAGGEVPYYHKLGNEAALWIETHPWDFVFLSARRFLQFYLPPRWFWFIYGAPGEALWLRQLLVWATAMGAFCTLAVMASRTRAYAYLLVAVSACSIPYILVQPTLRYRYLVSSLLIFLALDGVGRLIAHGLDLRRRDLA